jgi:3'-phosphoadenosine 5'-phosphosulfate sulfotransferase (PAPS reductase)/FAD synthetase
MTTHARMAKVFRKAAGHIAEGGDIMAGLLQAADKVPTLLDCLAHLALYVDTEPCTRPWTRINAWVGFADTRNVTVALQTLAHQLDPVRLPIGYLTINPARHNPLDLAHRVIVATSGGKDSVVMEDVVCTQAAERGVLHKVIAVHNDLGTTGEDYSNQPVEWPGTEELARRQTARYGIPFEVTQRPGGGLFQQLVNQRKKFPSSAARWCTSDQKTNEGMKRVTHHVSQARETEGVDHVIVYYCVGLRAQESPARARKAEFTIDRSASNRRRTVIRWHPILDWTQRQVWQHIKDQNLEYHEAYDAGMDRLSCRLCVLATRSDLVCAARQSPELIGDYAKAEQQIGHTFQQNLSIAEIQKEATELGPITDVTAGVALERHLSADAPAEQLALPCVS